MAETKGRSEQKARKLNKKSRRAIAALAVLLLAGVSFSVYAKYYKTGFNKGMAIASGFYFSSSHMAVNDEIKGLTMQEIAEKHLSSIITSTSISSSENETIPVEIRNYDNQLLYNDKDLNVEYQVDFMLLEQPSAGAGYQVGDGRETKSLGWSNGRGTVVSFTGKLSGGMTQSDIYTLTVGKAGDQKTSSNVLMVAYPVGPDYLQNTKCIAGIVNVTFEEREFQIVDSGFEVRKTDKWTEADWKEAVEKESGFVYELYTSGNIRSGTASTATSTRKKIQVKWDAGMFKINANDKYYLSVKDDPDKYKTVSEDGVTWQVMEIEVLPYASIKFVFFRDEDFETKSGAMADSSEFEDSVKVTLLP